eukprot:SAG22_NODE_1132_length_5437_cov_8.133945_5_plen_92_part_00
MIAVASADTMRTREWRYTEWRLWQGELLVADWSQSGLLAIEMYDHCNDTGVGPSSFDDFEFENLGFAPQYDVERGQLASLLKAGFGGKMSG